MCGIHGMWMFSVCSRHEFIIHILKIPLNMYTAKKKVLMLENYKCIWVLNKTALFCGLLYCSKFHVTWLINHYTVTHNKCWWLIEMTTTGRTTTKSTMLSYLVYTVYTNALAPSTQVDNQPPVYPQLSSHLCSLYCCLLHI